MVYLGQFFLTYAFKDNLTTGIQNGDEALQSISLASRGLLVIMLITLEQHDIF